MSSPESTFEQGGKHNTQNNNTHNGDIINAAPENNSNFSDLLGSNIVFNHNAFNEIIPLVYQSICKEENNQSNDFLSIDIDEKNKINNFSEEYFTLVEEDYYPYFFQLEKFIRLRGNRDLQQKLDLITKSLKERILALQIENPKVKFEQILLDIGKSIIDRNHDAMKDKENEIMLLLYYFYTTCSIGKKE